MGYLKRLSSLGKASLIILGFVILAAVTVPLMYWVERRGLNSRAGKAEYFLAPLPPANYEFHIPGLIQPETVAADKTTLGNDDQVIGIEAGGKFRAYDIRSMGAKSRHVLNDMLSGKAVTVTYCDLADCARAYGGTDRPNSLDIALAGLDDGHMLLQVGETVYFQESAKIAKPNSSGTEVAFPYASFPLKRMTWGEWKSLHPQTDVYQHTVQTKNESKKSTAGSQ